MEPDSSEPKPVSSLEAERLERIRELEARLAKKSSVGVMPAVAALGLLACVGMLLMMRLDIAYFFSSRQPLSLGSEGQYRFDLLSNNHYVEIHGLPTRRGNFGEERGGTVVMVGIRDTPIALVRGALEGESWKPGAKPGQPDQRPFTVRGRLLKREDASRYESSGFLKLAQMGEVNPRWVILEGEKPGADSQTFMLLGLLLALGAFNAWLLLRALQARAKR